MRDCKNFGLQHGHFISFTFHVKVRMCYFYLPLFAADSTVTCDMEWGFGDHCFLIAESYGWKADDFHVRKQYESKIL